jgi:hypothetical protein
MELLKILIWLALGATAVSLLLGIVSMERSSEHSTRYMFIRVGVQGFTLAVLLIAAFLARR